MSLFREIMFGILIIHFENNIKFFVLSSFFSKINKIHNNIKKIYLIWFLY